MERLLDPFVFGVAACVVLVGAVYAVYIALAPFADHFTWFAVVIGVGFTNLGITTVLLHLVGDWAAVAVVWLAYVLTGGPMIAGQLVKHWHYRRTVRRLRQAQPANNHEDEQHEA